MQQEGKKDTKKERRENEHEWQAGLGGMHNSFTECSGVV